MARNDFELRNDKHAAFFRERLNEKINYSMAGGTYQGTVNNELRRHGYGQMDFSNGNCYKGYWKNNKQDGKGLLISN